MKYNYDKSVLKGLSVKPFLNQVKLRNQKISEAPDDMPVSVFNANRLAASLHPPVQHTKITEVTDFGFAKRFVLTADPERGTSKMAFFRAGQYVSVSLQIGNATLNKPYSICSSPSDALNREKSSYTLTVKHSEFGYASSYILDNWKEGDRIDISGPLGEFYYQELRDAPNVVALAGGSGITPFFSMASAIADGIENFNMTILYGSRKEEDILLKNGFFTFFWGMAVCHLSFSRSCLLRERCHWRPACLWPPPATRLSYRIADPVSSVKSERLAADHTFSTMAFSFAIYWMVSMNI